MTSMHGFASCLLDVQAREVRLFKIQQRQRNRQVPTKKPVNAGSVPTPSNSPA